MDPKQLVAMVLTNEKLTADEKLKMVTAIQAMAPKQGSQPNNQQPNQQQKKHKDDRPQDVKPPVNQLEAAEKLLAEKAEKEAAEKKRLEENVEATIYLKSGYLADLELLPETAKAKFNLVMESVKDEGVERAKTVKQYITKLYTDNLPTVKAPVSSSLKARIEEAKLKPENGYDAMREYAELFKLQTQKEIETQANSALATEAQYAALSDAEKREHDQSKAHIIRAQKLMDKVKKDD